MKVIEAEQIIWMNYYRQDANNRVTPRVLLIGDSICEGYYHHVVEYTKNKYVVDKITSSRVSCDPIILDELEYALKQSNYNIIHFNNGLHDFRVSTETYVLGLKKMIDLFRSKYPEAKLVFATSTSISMNKEEPLVFNPIDNAVVLERNVAAVKLMKAENIAINDLYGYVVSSDIFKKSDSCHFTDETSMLLAKKIAENI